MTRSWRASGVRRGRLLAPLAVALTLGAAGLAAAELAAAPAAQAAVTTTFNHTGEQVYAVPAGVTAVTITAAGAPGGAGQYQGPATPSAGVSPGTVL